MPAKPSRERGLVWLLCCIAAIRVFIFCAAFPFFNNVDEPAHFDLVVRYSRAQMPRTDQRISVEAAQDIVLFGSPEYLMRPEQFENGRIPSPLWWQSDEEIKTTFLEGMTKMREFVNHEVSSPPLYYALAGAWLRTGRGFGMENEFLLYWIRFLNIALGAALVWLGYVAARIIFPEDVNLRLGLPMLLAFFPQDTFYSIQSDVMSPLCFGTAFVGLMIFLRDDSIHLRTAALTGLALAAAFLAKTGNVPLLLVSAIVVAIKIQRLAGTGGITAALPGLILLFFCAVLPVIAWCVWSYHAFGDFTGSSTKIRLLGWTAKPLGQWWPHPVFTTRGLATFWSELMTSFWRGEFVWFRQRLASPVADRFYWVSTLLFIGIAAFNFKNRFLTASQKGALWFCFGSFMASLAFLVTLSIAFDFGDCDYPSRDHPYFTSGRLMSGALIPFLALYVYGLDCVLRWVKRKWLVMPVLAGICLLMTASEILANRPAFASDYNWFHLWTGPAQ